MEGFNARCIRVRCSSARDCSPCLALLAVGLLAGCGNEDESGGGGGSSGGKSEDPAALLKKAFATHVESGELKLKMNVDVKGSAKMSGPLSLEIGGPFKSRGQNELPLLDWDIDVARARARTSRAGS